MATYTTNATNFPSSQDGARTSTDTWNGTSATLIPDSSGGITGKLGWVGLQFAVPISTDVNGRTLDANLITNFTLTLQHAAPTPAGVLSVFYVPEAAPDPYSDTAVPGDRSEVFLTQATFEASDAHTITVPLLAADATGTSAMGAQAMTQYLRHSSWNGIVSLSLLWLGDSVAWISAEDAADGNEPSISTTENIFHTGFVDGPAFGRRARSRHCPRTGLPVASDELVRDGWDNGQMVSARGWDPEDPEDRYVPNPLEGVVDDEAQ